MYHTILRPLMFSKLFRLTLERRIISKHHKTRNNETTDLDERGAAEEEAKHVGHDVITDHTGNWHNEPIETKKSFLKSLV